MRALRWGILSTAAIGGLVAGATEGSPTARFTAVGSRSRESAARFAAEHGIPRAHGSYDDLLADDDVDAVYVTLPISMHVDWAVNALEAGKHVLCEKPMAATAADARRVADAERRTGRRCVEGLMWRLHPQTALARRLLDDGAIGRLLLVRAALTVHVPEGDIRRSPHLGGGAHLDLGCYCVSAWRLFGGEPERVHAEAVLDDAGVDLRMAATARLPGGVLGALDVGLDHHRRDELELVGSEGVLVVPDPWIGTSRSLWLRRNGREEEVVVPAGGPHPLGEGDDAVYRLEMDRVSRALLDGEPLPFGTDDAVAQAVVLEALRASAASGLPVVPAVPDAAGVATAAGG